MTDQSLPERTTVDNIFSSLTNTSSTALWDYVVSYSLDRLNPILANAWSEAKAPALKRKFTINDEPVAEALDFDVTLTWSQMQFKIDCCTAYAIVSVGITGTYTIRQTAINPKLCDDPRVVPIPPAVSLLFTVPSGSIHGSAIKDPTAAETEVTGRAEVLNISATML